jgi:hypothetical protein
MEQSEHDANDSGIQVNALFAIGRAGLPAAATSATPDESVF